METTGKAGKREDALLDALSLEKRRALNWEERANRYERMMDRAVAAIEDAKALRPDDYHLDRIERLLINE